MAVRIDEVAVRDLGPLRDFAMQMGDFNLIYGENETGKTYVVEFILRAVFRHASEWSLREPVGHGKVVLSGLEAEPVTFTSDTGKKLEDYWEEDDRGLPTNMATLLVVKGAELAVVKDRPGGISRAILKSYLSRDVLLDQILDRIPPTIQKARVVDGTIDAKRFGDIKNREKLVGDRDRIERLFAQIDERYSAGPRRHLKMREEALETEVEQLVQAKRHLAYVINQEIKDLERQRDSLPEPGLKELESRFDAYQRKLGELGEKERQQEDLAHASTNHAWVQEAINLWESRELERAAGPNLALLLLGAGSLLASLITALADINVLAVLLFPAGVVLAGFYLRGLHRQLHATAESDELRRLSEDYEVRFGEKLSSLAELRRREAALEEPHFKAKYLKEQFNEIQGEIEELVSGIAAELRVLTGDDHPREEYEQVISTLRTRSEELDDEANQRRLKLALLGVDEADYMADEAPIGFDPSRLESLEVQLQEIEGQLREAETDLDSLKQSICSETGDDISIPWPDLLERLRQRRQEISDDCKGLTARILAQIAVSEVLEDIKAHEDETIKDGLRARYVRSLIHHVTGRYESLDLMDDQLVASSPYGNYPLSDLSTGAQEQVLLALRMGFAAMLAGGQPLFLILDDAFQHSDWHRRGRLVEEVVNLAEKGWQIVYLTMDDHLRDLLLKAGEEQFGEAFSYKTV